MKDGTVLTKDFKYTINTDGGGLWSDVEKPVQTTRIECIVSNYDDYDKMWGELRVFFDTDTWNPYKDGLIYTDQGFLDELRGYLELNGLSSEVEYSEQGMQGDNYVSLDVNEDFINSWELDAIF